MNGGQAIGGVDQIPIAARKLGQEGQCGVPQEARYRHLSAVAEVVKAIAFGVVGQSGADGRHHGEDQARIDLTVSIDLDQNLHIIF